MEIEVGHTRLMERVSNQIWTTMPNADPAAKGASLVVTCGGRAYMLSFQHYQDAGIFLRSVGLLPSMPQIFKCLFTCFELGHRINFQGRHADEIVARGVALDAIDLHRLESLTLPCQVYSYLTSAACRFPPLKSPKGMPVIAILSDCLDDEPSDTDS